MDKENLRTAIILAKREHQRLAAEWRAVDQLIKSAEAAWNKLDEDEHGDDA